MVVFVAKSSSYLNYNESSRARAKRINIMLDGDSREIKDLNKNYPNALFTFTDSAKYQS